MPEINLHINMNNLPWMKCVCGGEIFIKIYKLKYISVLQTGQGKSGTWAIELYKCVNPECGLEINEAKTEAELKVMAAAYEKRMRQKAKAAAEGGINAG
jgi:hypothetical protein